ncbi:hypothetical protein K1719_009210 [Acacia pycnantha]|nr:hypothetical protein K1719_009210 [Acacia pycnantha]
MVDSDVKPAMGFIYVEIDRAKERIAHAFNNVERGYRPIWDVIDDRWDKQLHRPLHAAVPPVMSATGVPLRWSIQREEIV